MDRVMPLPMAGLNEVSYRTIGVLSFPSDPLMFCYWKLLLVFSGAIGRDMS